MEDLILKINGNEYNAHCDKESYDTIFVNGNPYEIELLKKIHDNIFSFSVNQRLLQVELDFVPDNKLNITLDGLIYEIDITDSTQEVLSKYIKASGKSGSNEGVVKAPMPGMIVKIYVNEGMHVMKDDKIIVVEAMKMENVLKSPVSGTVKSVKVKEGTAVDKNSVLIEIEPSEA